MFNLLLIIVTFLLSNNSFALSNQRSIVYKSESDTLSFKLSGEYKVYTDEDVSTCHGPQVRVCRPVSRTQCNASGCRTVRRTSCRMEYNSCSNSSSTVVKKSYVANVRIHFRNLAPLLSIEDRLHVYVDYIKYPSEAEESYEFKFSLSESMKDEVVYKFNDYTYSVEAITGKEEAVEIDYYVDILPADNFKKVYGSKVQNLSLQRDKLFYTTAKVHHKKEFSPYIRVLNKRRSFFGVKKVLLYEGNVPHESYKLHSLSSEESLVEIDLSSLLKSPLRSGEYEVGAISTQTNPLVGEYGAGNLLKNLKLPAYAVEKRYKYETSHRVKNMDTIEVEI